MYRRSVLAGGVAALVAGCLGEEDETASYSVVADPYDSIPPGPTTHITAEAVDGLIETVVTEALETNAVVTEQLTDEQRESTVAQIDSLPRYEGDEEFMAAAYVTRDDAAAAVFYESHL